MSYFTLSKSILMLLTNYLLTYEPASKEDVNTDKKTSHVTMNSKSRDESKTSTLDTLVEHCQNEAEIQDIPADLQLASHVAASQPVSCGSVGFFSSFSTSFFKAL